MKISRAKIIGLLGFLVLALGIFFSFKPVRHFFQSFMGNQTSTFLKKEVKAEPWMTVFIHGSFSSLLGFLSFSNVLSDRVSGTVYRKVTKAMRDDDHFFKEQPILQRGLVKIEPTYDLKKTGNKKYAVYPLAQAYQDILESVSPGKELNMFYTFGWSGLMSQNSRRFEAIRLYNALAQELAMYHAQGIYPKIRLIAHSHGGNVCLNLAAVSSVINSHSFKNLTGLTKNSAARETLKKIFEIFESLQNKEAALARKDQKHLDYVPVQKNVVIDELIMLGTPIQEETESFCFFPVFKKVYNLYSDEDVVQRSDWATSRSYYSRQKIVVTPEHEKEFAGHPKLVQARIMIDRSWTEPSGDQESGALLASNTATAVTPEPTIWEKIVSGTNPFSRKTKDPLHKELWFFSWKDDSKTDKKEAAKSEEHATFLGHLPTIVMIPLMLEVLSKSARLSSFDLNLKMTHDFVIASIAHCNQTKALASKKIPASVLKEIKEKTLLWKPDMAAHMAEFRAIYKHM